MADDVADPVVSNPARPGATVDGNRIELIEGGEERLRALLELIAHAEHSVRDEQVRQLQPHRGEHDDVEETEGNLAQRDAADDANAAGIRRRPGASEAGGADADHSGGHHREHRMQDSKAYQHVRREREIVAKRSFKICE